MYAESVNAAQPAESIRNLFAPASQVLEDAIASGAFPGCAFGVLAGGAVLVEDALGRFTYDPDSLAVSPQTIYDVASLTKVMATTAATMLLVQRGRLQLDTPLAELLPGFIVGRPPGSSARHVTLQHLLAHSSGLPGYVEFFRSVSTAAELFRGCLELPLEAAPGERAEYSDPGFILLGKALEVVMGQRLDSFVQREVFDPLGMRATGFNPPLGLRPGIPPTEEDTTFRHHVIQGEVQDENACVLGGVAGHAGLFSNVTDILRFSAATLAGLETDSERSASIHSGSPATDLFRGETVLRFAESQPPPGSSRALGWDTPSENSSSGRHFSPRSIGHLGYSGCSLWIDLDAKIAVVLLTNRTWPDRKNQLIREVRPVFYNAVRIALSASGNTTLGPTAD